MGLAVSARIFSDIDELGEAIGWDLDFRQLDRGRFQGSAQVIAGQEVAIMHVRFNRAFHQRGHPPTGMMTYGLLEREVGPISWCGADHQVDDIVDFNVPSGFDGGTPSNHHAYTFSIAADYLRRTAESLGVDPEMVNRESRNSMSGDSHVLRACELRHIFRRLFASVQPDGTINGLRNKDLGEMLATEILRRKQQPTAKRTTLNPPTRIRLCRRAVAVIDAYAHDSVSIADVCRATGTSLSTLERAFRDQFGITPKRYMTNRRLIGVRRELRSGHQRAVSRAANCWGFWHMGQFARDYKMLFGELPSQTLRVYS